MTVTAGVRLLLPAALLLVFTIEKISADRKNAHRTLLAGAAEERVPKAIGTGIERCGGPATVALRFALKVRGCYSEAQ